MRVVAVFGSIVLAASLALPTAASAARKCERLIATGAVDNPPFLWRDPQDPQRVIGASADLARQIADALGLQLQVLPLGDANQALAEVKSGRADLLLDAELLTEHLQALDYVHPAIATLEIAPWVRSDQMLAYASREDLIGQPGMRLKDEAMGAQFDAFAREQLTVEGSDDIQQALRALAEGRIAYLLHERYATVAGAASMGLVEELQVLQPPVLSKSMHLALGQDSACNDAWLRGKLAVQMTELRAAGVPAKLIAENLERWLEQQHQLAPEAPIQD